MKKISDTQRENLFHVLKSIVDYKMPRVRAGIRQAQQAERDISDLGQQLRDLEIVLNREERINPADAVETREIIEAKEAQLSNARYRAKTFGMARGQAAAAQAFYDTYHQVTRGAELNTLYHNLRLVQDRMDYLDDRIEACEINLATAQERNVDACDDSRTDLGGYRRAYADALGQYNALMHQIQMLER